MRGHFGFLLFDQVEDMDLIGPFEMIGIWSRLFNGPEKLITISENGFLVKSINGLSIQPDTSFDQCPALDYLLVPGGMGTRQEVNNEKLVSFIKDRGLQCKAILSVCTGAFLLQAAGWLHHKKATTHWASLDRLRAFKDVDVVEQRFTHDGHIWTSAGISAGSDLALAFIAAVAGEEIAGQVQLQAEYYPANTVYHTIDGNLPAYVREVSSNSISFATRSPDK